VKHINGKGWVSNGLEIQKIPTSSLPGFMPFRRDVPNAHKAHQLLAMRFRAEAAAACYLRLKTAVSDMALSRD